MRTSQLPHNRFDWIRQKPDSRDWQYKVHDRLGTGTIPTVDLSKNMGPQLNQGNLGSCGPNTADELITYDQKAEKLTVAQASRLFIYYNTRVLMGTSNQDSGVDNRTMMQALAASGTCAESLWPYSDTIAAMRKKPSAAAYAAAVKINNYAAVGKYITPMRGTLVSGLPFMFGFDCFNQIMSAQAAKNGILTMPLGVVIGGHDVTICGYSEIDAPGVLPGNKWPRRTFKFRNHWLNDDGIPWGDGGYGYIPYNYALGSHASDFWVINAVPAADISQPAEYHIHCYQKNLVAFARMQGIALAI